MKFYFTSKLQVKQIPVSTGEPVLYYCTVTWQLRQVYTVILSGVYS